MAGEFEETHDSADRKMKDIDAGHAQNIGKVYDE
jgi:hypothetical protein